jgi:hypothetical protein
VKQNKKLNKIKNSRELRKAKAELSMLSSYLFECEEALREYSIEWSEDINFILKELSSERKTEDKKDNTNFVNTENFEQQSTNQSREDREELEVKNTAPSWVKKAFRKIALKTHPDKLKDQENAQEMQELYSQANSAITEENYDLLLEICQILSIENDIDPKVELGYNLKRQESIKGDLKKVTESLPWIWCEAYDDLPLRKKILLSVLPHYGISLESHEVLGDILVKIKAE